MSDDARRCRARRRRAARSTSRARARTAAARAVPRGSSCSRCAVLLDHRAAAGGVDRRSALGAGRSNAAMLALRQGARARPGRRHARAARRSSPGPPVSTTLIAVHASACARVAALVCGEQALHHAAAQQRDAAGGAVAGGAVARACASAGPVDCEHRHARSRAGPAARASSMRHAAWRAARARRAAPRAAAAACEDAQDQPRDERCAAVPLRSVARVASSRWPYGTPTGARGLAARGSRGSDRCACCTSGSSSGSVALEQRAHQHDASARAVVLVLEREVGGAGLQAEAAVHAGIDARQLRPRAVIRASRTARRRRDGVDHAQRLTHRWALAGCSECRG